MASFAAHPETEIFLAGRCRTEFAGPASLAFSTIWRIRGLVYPKCRLV